MSTAEETIARLREKAAEESEQEEKEVQEEEPSRSTVREYIVLSLGGGHQWTEVEHINAGSTEAAIKSLGDQLKSGTTYVAVPTRNWNPVTAEIETKTTLTLK